VFPSHDQTDEDDEDSEEQHVDVTDEEEEDMPAKDPNAKPPGTNYMGFMK